MSVAIIDGDELAAFYAALLLEGIAPGSASHICNALAEGNRRAFEATYGESLPQITWTPGSRDPVPPVPDWTVAEWAGNLLYNAISNEGTCFLEPAVEAHLRALPSSTRGAGRCGASGPARPGNDASSTCAATGDAPQG